MKAIHYSPFNRTYKYMCLQNQLAHTKNKNQIRGLVDSNLTLTHDHSKLRRSKTRLPFDGSLTWSSSLGNSMCGRLK